MLDKFLNRIKERRALRLCLREFDRYKGAKPPSMIRGRWL